MKSIEFSTPMMRALIRGEKTMTRRRVKLPRRHIAAGCTIESLHVTTVAPARLFALDANGDPWAIPTRYQVGDLANVKEPLYAAWAGNRVNKLVKYDADGNLVSRSPDGVGMHLAWRWKHSSLPARYCPREASRYTIRITSRRCERVQEITEADADREGFLCAGHGDDWQRPDSFRTTWDELHGAGAWDRNDWVWVYGFEVQSWDLRPSVGGAVPSGDRYLCGPKPKEE
jgi:hypothetical protein